VTLIGILQCLGLGDGKEFMFSTLIEAYMACYMYDFSRDAQLQATFNTSCWHEAFVPFVPMASHGRTLCYGEEPNDISR
jgi:hypothetical protein